MRSPNPTVRRPSHLTPTSTAATRSRTRLVLVLVREAAGVYLRAAGVDDVLVFRLRGGRGGPKRWSR